MTSHQTRRDSIATDGTRIHPPGARQLRVHAPSAEARDSDKARALWELSLKLTKA